MALSILSRTAIILIFLTSCTNHEKNKNRIFADISNGKTIFKKYCISCHNLSTGQKLYESLEDLREKDFIKIMNGDSLISGNKHIDTRLSFEELVQVKTYLDSTNVSKNYK